MRTLVVTCAVLALSASAFAWVGPYQLTDEGNNTLPSACVDFLPSDVSCMVWQTDRNGNWDIHSLFCSLTNSNGWHQEMTVSADSGDDIHPAVAACFADASFWCVRERRISPILAEVWATRVTYPDSWSEPEMIGRALHTAGDSAFPSIIVVPHDTVDTAWAAWCCHDTDGYYISYSFHDGDSWSEPDLAVSSLNSIQDVKLGRGRSSDGYGCPMLVWEEYDNIYYSEYDRGSWTTPYHVGPSGAPDWSPSIVNYGPSRYWEWGPWILWVSIREGDTAVYTTPSDTFSIGRRLCDTLDPGISQTPVGSQVAFTVDPWMYLGAWVSDRRGNSDIYYRWWSDMDLPVDTNLAEDLNPTLTAMGAEGGRQMIWCCWQSDRDGDWDLYGSFMYNSGIEAKDKVVGTKDEILMPTVVSGGRLRLPRDMTEFGSANSDRIPRPLLLDATGRLVMQLHAGDNDVRHVSPGVYFVRRTGPRGQGFEDSRKLLLTD